MNETLQETVRKTSERGENAKSRVLRKIKGEGFQRCEAGCRVAKAARA